MIRNMRLAGASLIALAFALQPAQASFTFLNSSSATTTEFAFDGSTTPAGTGNCASTTECVGDVPMDKSGTPLFTSTNPGLVGGLGTAGSPSGGVVSVQGVTSGQALPNNTTQWDSTALGAPTALGTSPSGNVIGANVDIVACASGVCNNNGAATPGNSSPVTPANQPVGGANFTLAQVSVASTATLIAAARTGVAGTGRISVTIVNTTSTAVYLGGSGVTTSTGALLPGIVGAARTINTTAAIYGIVATGAATVTEDETY